MKVILGTLLLALAGPALGADLLRNARFDEPPGPGGAVSGWMSRGEQYGKARLVTDRAASPTLALELTAVGKGSTGNESFMLYQIIPHEKLRGRKVKFGAKIWTEGAGVNLVLFTPEGQANAFDPNVKSGGFKPHQGSLVIPKNASYLTFGVQLFGPAGGKAWVDDAFVEVEGERAENGPPAGPPPGPAAPPADRAAPGGAEVRVAVEAGRVERAINPWIYCMHIEWVEDGLGLMEHDRPVLREQVMSKLRPLHIPLFRFPGGIHADYYDWKNGIGPQEKRGQSENVFTKKVERHRFGTPEFAKLLQETGASALITANFGTGTAEQAGAWARYLADQHVPAPLWEVGNEIYLSGPKTDAPNGRRIFKPSDEYARRFAGFRDAIHRAMPDARVGAIAHLDAGAFPLSPPENRDWSHKMLGFLRSKADFVATHDAYAPVALDDSNDYSTDAKRREGYRSLYAAADQTREDLDELAARIDRQSPSNKGLPLAVTEYGPLFGVSGNPKKQAVFVDQSRTQAAAIYVASLLDIFIGHPRVMAACYTNPIHKWYGSLLTDTDQGLVVTPTYHVFSLYRSRFFDDLLSARIESGRFDGPRLGLVKERRGASEVLARASRSKDGRQVGIMLVNRSVDRDRQTEISLAGFPAASVDCKVLTAPVPWAINGPRLSDTTTSAGEIVPRALPCTGTDRIALRLPPNSLVSVVAQRG